MFKEKLRREQASKNKKKKGKQTNSPAHEDDPNEDDLFHRTFQCMDMYVREVEMIMVSVFSYFVLKKNEE